MDNNINDIDKFFKDRLDGFESPHVPGAWDSMAAMLDSDNSGAAIKNINRFILASVVGTIVLAGSVIAYISGYNTNGVSTYTSNNNVVTEAPATNKPAASEANTNEAAIIENNSTQEETINSTAPENTETNSTANSNTANSATTTQNTGTPEASTNNAPTKTAPQPIAVVEEQDNTPVAEAKKETTKPQNTEAVPFAKNNLQAITLEKKKLLVLDANGINNIDDYINKQKVLIDSALRREKELRDMERFYRPQFGIQAGGNFNRVINTSADNFELGSGIMVGVFFTHNISKKWGVNAELNYLRSNGNSISRNVTQTDYFLEKTTTNFFLVTKSFEYVQMPLSVSYSPTTRHKFSIGATGLLMVNSKTEVIENREKFADRSTTTTTENGVYEDLNTFNYGALLGYEYNLPGRYSLGLRYNQMFSDITNNNFFSDNKKHLPAHLQLYVKLNLTR